MCYGSATKVLGNEVKTWFNEILRYIENQQGFSRDNGQNHDILLSTFIQPWHIDEAENGETAAPLMIRFLAQEATQPNASW
ncbi:hypothetical protein SI65_04898 [Aspergillus cristatus]|uniref:Uncharacterized protein n=1 Tax=Aspergillus cristatus TaxID=573508 RepID=A0A1E3BG21_ASPCR|nr:hypothetical protein SI65_04898 [Aspergillus cristatus]